MDERTVLKREHTRIEQLFTEFDALPERAYMGRGAIIGEIDSLVRGHFIAGQDVERLDEEQRRRVFHMLDEVAATDPHDEGFLTRAHAVREALREHIRAELG